MKLSPELIKPESIFSFSSIETITFQSVKIELNILYCINIFDSILNQ
jgi:hypothetical protein